MASHDLLPIATELLAALHEIAGNGPAAFSLRDVGAVGAVLERQQAAIVEVLSNTRAAETEQAPVAWRYRYLHHDQPTHWIVRQSPIASCEPGTDFVGIEVQPLYVAPKSAAETELRRGLDEALILLRELRAKESSRQFYGIGGVLNGKLLSIELTMQSALSNTGGGG